MEKKKSEVVRREEEVLAFWQENGIFEKTLAKEAPHGDYVFYDGPPFATGLPHMGHLLISAYKDAIGRYKTMRGFHVSRRWGWDCHGLPIETIVEKKLGLTTKKEIETMGIDRFNEEAKKSVLTYVHDWKQYVTRLGRWVDFDNSYKTMDNTYMESVWWALKKIHTDGRLYEGRKVLPYCTRCETPLSKAEIAMDNSYKDVTDEAVFVKFKVQAGKKAGSFVADDKTYIIAWTTTPWTLPANVVLAVKEEIVYAVLKNKNETIIISKEKQNMLEGVWELVAQVDGRELVGLSYEPLFEVPKNKSDMSYKVYTADFVTTEEGTGVVHIAPVYGEDDFTLGTKHNLPVSPLLDATGTYTNNAPEFIQGMFYKKGGKYVLEDLERRGLVLKKHPITHSYPHCYRCNTPLIYNALSSWFINIQSVKHDLLTKNESISWYPNHLKEGRFKHIVETAPDWTISRNRFWATPLPIWKHEKTGEVSVFGSLEELRAHTKKSGNTYFVMRHGEAENNVREVISCKKENTHSLTEKGKKQVAETLTMLKEKKIQRIIVSPFLRTKETAEMVARGLGLSLEAVVYDDRLGEWNTGQDGELVEDVRTKLPTLKERFEKKAHEEGETLLEMKTRVGEVLYELEEKYTGEVILIITHEYVAWLLEAVARGLDADASARLGEELRAKKGNIVQNAEIRTLDFAPLSHDATYALDLHRPYIDRLPLVAKDGSRLVRIPEVVDCWVESGAMPCASIHYPMEHSSSNERHYPADFIAEYIAQTRTWFYYMHALGVLLFEESSFKNCVATGTILASDGTKMSKSKGNYTDPLEEMHVYGADALRLHLLGSVVMQAEDLSYKEEDVREVYNKFVNTLWNCYTFYALYAKGNESTSQENKNILDKWIHKRLSETVQGITSSLDAYDTVGSARLLKGFVNDLSTWYLQCSRDRFKSENEAEKREVLATMREVLLTLAKLSAPITPFISESLYRGLYGEEESVHKEVWPESKVSSRESDTIISDMTKLRAITSLVLEKRQRAGIKVRQPLTSVTLYAPELEGKEEYISILKDKVNVKEVFFDETLTDEHVVLDTKLTPELIHEGDVREFVRAVQEERKTMCLIPSDEVVLVVSQKEHPVLKNAQDLLTRIAGVSALTEGQGEKKVTFADGSKVSFVLRKK
jgi:isoleucyl-tRNA synthetase